MFLTAFFLQHAPSQAVDTLSKAADPKWKALSQMSQSTSIIQDMASHNLIFIVLGVTLIIWLVLLFFIIRLDRKVSQLEEEQKKTELYNQESL